MKEWWSYWYNKYGVIVACASICYAGYQVIGCIDMSAEAWGTWAGSIGTVGTLIGTIWLATSGERRRREEQRIRGAIVLPALFGYATEMKIHAEAIASAAKRVQLQKEISAPAWKALVEQWNDDYRKIPEVPDAYLVDVAAISYRLASRLNGIHADNRMARLFIDTIDIKSPTFWNADSQFMNERFETASEDIDRVIQEISLLKIIHNRKST